MNIGLHRKMVNASVRLDRFYCICNINLRLFSKILVGSHWYTCILIINKWIIFAYHYTVCNICMLKFKSFILLDVGEISPSKSSGCKCPRSLDSGLVGDYTDFIWSESVLELEVECHEISRLVSKITSCPFVWGFSSSILRQAFKNLLIHSCRRIKEHQSCEQVIK